MPDVTVAPADTGVLVPALARQPGHLLWRAHGRVQGLAARLLPPDLDLHGYAVLVVLADGAPRSQQTLADTIGVSRTTLGNVAIDLDAQGLVERVRNPEDRRSYALTRTARGARTARRWARYVERLEAALAAPYDDGELAELRQLLLTVVEPELLPGTPEELRCGLPFLLARAKGRVHVRFVELLGPLELDPRHYGSLTVLTELGPVSQAELARALGVSGACAVQLADDLEERGLAERRRLPSDRRTQVLHLRPASKRALRAAAPLADQAVAERLAPLGERQRRRLATLLVQLVTAD